MARCSADRTAILQERHASCLTSAVQLSRTGAFTAASGRTQDLARPQSAACSERCQQLGVAAKGAWQRLARWRPPSWGAGAVVSCAAACQVAGVYGRQRHDGVVTARSMVKGGTKAVNMHVCSAWRWSRGACNDPECACGKRRTGGTVHGSPHKFLADGLLL